MLQELWIKNYCVFLLLKPTPQENKYMFNTRCIVYTTSHIHFHDEKFCGKKVRQPVVTHEESKHYNSLLRDGERCDQYTGCQDFPHLWWLDTVSV